MNWDDDIDEFDNWLDVYKQMKNDDNNNDDIYNMDNNNNGNNYRSANNNNNDRYDDYDQYNDHQNDHYSPSNQSESKRYPQQPRREKRRRQEEDSHNEVFGTNHHNMPDRSNVKDEYDDVRNQYEQGVMNGRGDERYQDSRATEERLDETKHGALVAEDFGEESSFLSMLPGNKMGRTQQPQQSQQQQQNYPIQRSTQRDHSQYNQQQPQQQHQNYPMQRSTQRDHSQHYPPPPQPTHPISYQNYQRTPPSQQHYQRTQPSQQHYQRTQQQHYQPQMDRNAPLNQQYRRQHYNNGGDISQGRFKQNHGYPSRLPPL